jgi:putative tricarboxylic transport membrane protein
VPLILVISLIGVHSVENSLFDVWVMLGFGLVGSIARRRAVRQPG